MNTTIQTFGRRDVCVETAVTLIDCASCGLIFGIGKEFEQRRREDHKGFYCPNGHSLSYNGPSEAEQKAERLEKRLQLAEDSERFYRGQAKQNADRARAQKGANTKLRKRIAAGVCPCCKRTFQNVARHIAGQHPNYTEADS